MVTGTLKGITMDKKIIIAVAALLILSFMVLYSMQPTPSPESAKPEAIKVKIGYSALRISLPIFVAMERGYFEEQGLDVALERFDTAQPLMQALVAGTVDMAGYTALPITYTSMLRANKSLYFVTAMMEDNAHPISILLVKKNETEIGEISDLKGKKIGVLPTVAYQKWMRLILSKNGIADGEASIVPIDPMMESSALASGQIDALFTNDPVATSAVQAGIAKPLRNGSVVPEYLGEPYMFGSFNLRKEYADANPTIAAKMAKALDKAVNFINENPTEAKLDMKKYVQESQKQYVEKYPDALYLPTANVSSLMIERNKKQMVEYGIIDRELDLRGLAFQIS